MKLETWIEHMEKASGLKRPSLGGDKLAWKAQGMEHLANKCEACLDRRKTRKANHNASARHEALTSFGLVRVRGNLGGVYYE